jgi:outer membrane protein
MSVMRAGVFPLILLVALCGVQTAAQAQQKKAPSQPELSGAAPGLHVLVVDVQSLLQNSKSAKMVRKQIEEKRAEYAKEISHQEEALRHERDQLQRQQASLSPAALNQKGREFQQKVNELDRSVQAKRQALEHSNAEALEKIQAAMLKIITDIAKQRKANLVFQRSQLVLFDQSFDVTDEVQQKLDEELPTLTVNFATPVEAAPSEKHTAPAHTKRRK